MAGLLLLAGLSSEASACSCMETSVKDLATSADEIYVATLQEAKLVAGNSKHWPTIEGKFLVSRTLKGRSRTGAMSLRTAADGAACGIGMLVSARYVIFKKRDDNSIAACDGSGVLGRFGIVGQFEEAEVAAEVHAASKTSGRASPKK